MADPSNTNGNNNSTPHFGTTLQTKQQPSLSPCSCSSSSFCSLSTIQCLNNHGCVLLMKGDFAEANFLFKSAITNHEQFIALSTASSCTSSSFRRCHCDNYEDIVTQNSNIIGISSDHSTTTTSSNTVDDTTTHCPMQAQSATAPTTTAPFPHDLCDEEEDDQIYSDYNEGLTDTIADVTNEYEISSDSVQEEVASSSLLSSLRVGGDNATTGLPLRRMTTDSQLRIYSCCGQQDHQNIEDRSLQFHQVYSLPIIMKIEEWITSSVEDRSFVLIYNTALCNHLWGMQLLVTMRDNQAVTNINKPNRNSSSNTQGGGQVEVVDDSTIILCERAFVVAQSLYRLAIENVSVVVGVDKICYVALFNNASHTCKTLHGYHSQVAYRYDELLLKAIFWWRDSTDESSSSSSFTTIRSTTTAITNNDYDYADNNLDIIDAFLENVFYLIGAQDAFVPAPAA